MQGAGALAGYRYIWHSLHLKHHINVLQSLVASILKEIDPEGKLRRRKEERHDFNKRCAYVSEGPIFCSHMMVGLIIVKLIGYIL